MTKNKQKNNPKFSFLYGGEHFNYYQYKVTTEQASKHRRRAATLLVILAVPGSRLRVCLLELKCTSAVYSSKAIGRWPGGPGALRCLYGTEQAICTAPTGRIVPGDGKRPAAALARRRPARRAARRPGPSQRSDTPTQRSNHTV